MYIKLHLVTLPVTQGLEDVSKKQIIIFFRGVLVYMYYAWCLQSIKSYKF